MTPDRYACALDEAVGPMPVRVLDAEGRVVRIISSAELTTLKKPPLRALQLAPKQEKPARYGRQKRWGNT